MSTKSILSQEDKADLIARFRRFYYLSKRVFPSFTKTISFLDAIMETEGQFYDELIYRNLRNQALPFFLRKDGREHLKKLVSKIDEKLENGKLLEQVKEGEQIASTCLDESGKLDFKKINEWAKTIPGVAAEYPNGLDDTSLENIYEFFTCGTTEERLLVFRYMSAFAEVMVLLSKPDFIPPETSEEKQKITVADVFLE